MATIIDLGQKVKAKYPVYSNMDDADLGKKVKAKYPGSYDDFNDISKITPDKYVETQHIEPDQATLAPNVLAVKGEKVNPDKYTETVTAKTPTFFDKLKQNTQQRAGNLMETIDAQAQGKQTWGETLLQSAGQGAGLVNDTAGQVVDKVTPEAIKRPIASLFSKAASSQTGQELMGEVNNFTQAHPRATRDLGAVFNIGSTYAGAKAAAKTAGVVSDGVNSVAQKVTGKSLGEMFAQRAEEQATKKGLKAIMPAAKDLTKLEKENALQQGRGTVKGLFNQFDVVASEKEKDVARTVGKIVKNDNPIKDIGRLENAVAKKGDEVIQYLKGNDIGFDENKVRGVLQDVVNSDERQLFLVGDEAAQKTYNGTMETFMKVLKRKPQTLSGLLETRKEFDQIAKRSISGVFDKMNPKSVAVQDIRRAVNDFIANELPEGNPYKAQLKEMSHMYTGVEYLSEKGAKDVGTNAISRWMNRNPIKRKILKGGGLATLGAVGGKGLYDILH